MLSQIDLLKELDRSQISHVIFDIDGTISDTNIGTYFFFLKKQLLSPLSYRIWKASFVSTYVPALLAIDRFSRAQMQRIAFRLYDQFPEELIRSQAKEYFAHVAREKMFPAVERIVGECRKRFAVSILSTNFDVLAEQYANYFDVSEWHAVSLSRWRDSGYSANDLGEFKSRIVSQFHSDQRFAVVADARSDLPILRIARIPIVVSARPPAWSYKLEKKVYLDPHFA